MFLNCWVRLHAPAQREQDDSDSSAERASVHLEQWPSAREGTTACSCETWEEGGEVGVNVKLGGVAVELTFLFA